MKSGMIKPIKYNLDKFENPFHKRLAQDHMAVDALCRRTSKISYEIKEKMNNGLPTVYKVIYRVKSIVGIDKAQRPLYGDKHVVRIELPPNYPSPDGLPRCFTETDVWHPNIKFKGDFKGRICYTAKSMGAWKALDMLIIRIGEILQYKNYHAIHIDPWPEDETVATWVKEYAEKEGIVNRHRNISVDKTPLLDPEEGVEIPPPKVGITIGAVRKGTTPTEKKESSILIGAVRRKTKS